MTKLDIPNVKNSSELIVYQLGELKNLSSNLDLKIDNLYTRLELRVAELEKFRAAQEAKSANAPIDWQKIVMGLISIITTLVLAFITAKQTGVLK